MDELPLGASPEVCIALYEAEATRVNRWINIGFGGLVGAIDEKESQLEDYTDGLKDWHAETQSELKAQDEKNEEIKKPERRIFGIKIN